ncbi:copper homeostasis membrane protein CopD [Brevundimonas sp.]|uniref:copper homeostasis membrane protein CopD n=1 Tax=Brevundimonas sp. TaxID=1871086 RepID=UPI002898A9A3|nr:copper homeostasis membrane protein CopD [Brevundimonas sp.]
MGLRAAQYAAAAVVLGLPAFMMYGGRVVGGQQPRWARSALGWSAATLALLAAAALALQTGLMAGALDQALNREALGFVLGGTALGAAYAVRIGAGLLLLAVLALRTGRGLWLGGLTLGLVVAASFAWTGHGAATEGPGHGLHLASDIAHAVAALTWLGAVFAFVALATRRIEKDAAVKTELATALGGFAGVGTLCVAVLLVTGLINSFYLVGIERVFSLGETAYGRLLTVKLAAFIAMLGLAALHRFRSTPALERGEGGLAGLRFSLGAELALGVLILALVGMMGMLAPPASL